MWRSWSLSEKAVALFWFCFAAALIPIAYVDASVHSVAGIFNVVGIFCVLLGFALSPSMFFESVSSLKEVPRPAARGLLGFIVFYGIACAVKLV